MNVLGSGFLIILVYPTSAKIAPIIIPGSITTESGIEITTESGVVLITEND